PTRRRHARRLDDYVRYKAAYGLARGAGDISAILTAFEAWPPTDSCSGAHDPRVLPLHVFDSSRVWPDLNETDGTARFDATYGRHPRRSDGWGRLWVPALVGHGQDSLTVSGRRLERGFHWDVRRGSAERLATCHEVWKLNPGGYANVYPDAHVRVGARYGRRVWPAR